jgi:predicted TPR repeat methyltransferase
VLLGLVRVKLGDRAGAEVAYRTALGKRPSFGAAWQCLGLVMEQCRDYGSAIDAFRTCVSLGDAGAAVWANLARLYYQTARVREAYDAYEVAVRADPVNAHYRQMLRKAKFVYEVQSGAAVGVALATYEGSAPETGDDAPTSRLDLLESAAALLTTSGDTDAAVRICRERLELSPSSASARYLLDVLVGEPGLDRSPPEYIVESFDAFAEQFDAKLVGVLGYDVPEQLCAIVRGATAPGRMYDTLDAGCGTGLCGPPLRPLASRLVGVDLSSKMLELAARRRTYDWLVRDELTAFLARSAGSFDLIVAADVLIYFGDLARIFGVAAIAMRHGGLLAVSTELLAEPSHGPSGYRVLPSGRFAHHPAYVVAAAGPAFIPELCVQTTLRLDADQRVAGSLFLFRRMHARP